MAKPQEKETYAQTQQAGKDVKQRQAQYSASKAPERAEARAGYSSGSADLAGRYTDLARTGGITPTSFNPIRQGYQNLGTTGGIDPSVSRNLAEGWRNQSVTGGFTPQNLQDIRGRTSSQVGAQFGRMREGLDRFKRGGGGYSPGYNAALAKFGRGQAQLGAETTRDTEIGIADAQRAGRLQGMQGELGLQESLRQGKQAGLAGQFGLEDFVRQGQMAGIGGLENINQQKLQELMRYDANELSMMGLSDSAIQSILGMQAQQAQRPGWFDNVMRVAGLAAGVAPSLMGLSTGKKTTHGTPPMSPG